MDVAISGTEMRLRKKLRRFENKDCIIINLAHVECKKI
jgi:hypothetical protein